MAKQGRDKPYRTLTTSKFIISAGLVIGLGIYFLYLGGEETKFWRDNGALRTLMEQLGGLLIVSGLLTVLWELVGKRAFAREVLENARVAAEIDASGLRRIGTHYLDDAGWEDLFRGVQKLDVFVAYGQTWRNVNLTHLQKLAKRAGGRIRVYLPDPGDQTGMGILASRFEMAPDELKARIRDTKRDFEVLRVHGGASIEVFYWTGDRLFGFYRFDNRAVVTLYKHSKGRSPILPTFVCEAGGSLYDFVYNELKTIRSASQPAV